MERQMTTLAQRHQVLRRVVAWIAVNVMHGERVAGGWSVRMAALLATPPRSSLDFVS
jgi:hypothetical protein